MFQSQSCAQTFTPDRSKIMVVDDNVEFLEELEEILSQSGYEAKTFPDSAKAYAAAQDIKPDLILLDLKMVPKSGFQVADQIRHSEKLKDVPIVAMTGHFTEQEHVLMMKLCGINSFILKPFLPLNLISKIEFSMGAKQEPLEDLQAT